MEVEIVHHGSQLFAKTKDGDLLKVKGLVIPRPEKAPNFYEPETSFFKAACLQELNTKLNMLVRDWLICIKVNYKIS